MLGETQGLSGARSRREFAQDTPCLVDGPFVRVGNEMMITPVRRRLLLVSLFTVSFLGALDHSIVSTSLATIAGELGALAQMSWVFVGYTLAATVSLPLIGKLGDELGPRRVFLFSLALFVASSIACGFAVEMPQLVFSRVVQGFSSAGLQLMSQTIVATVTSPRERPRLLSILGASFPVAIVVGPFIGGVITDHFGWRWVFWINVPLGILAFVLAALVVPKIEGRPRGRFDVAGAVTFTIGLVAIVLSAAAIADPALLMASLALLMVAVIAFTGFFLIELRVADPFVPLRIFKNRTVAAGIALSAIIGIGLFSVVSYIPTYIQLAYRTTATVSGLVPMATVLGMLVSSLLTGTLASRSGRYRRFAIAGTAISATGLFAMALLPVGLPIVVPMVLMGLVGIGTGCFMNLVIAVVQSAVPVTQIGAVTATTNLVRQVGSTICTALIGAVIGVGVVARLPASLDASTLTPGIARAASDAVQSEIAAVYSGVLQPVFFALAFAYGVGVAIAVILPSGRLSDDQAAQSTNSETQLESTSPSKETP